MSWNREEIAYCSNVHPCRTFGDLLDVIGRDVSGVRERRALDTMHTGLWIPASVAGELLHDSRRFDALAERMEGEGVRLFTLNGFPVGNFHDPVVKDKVYSPDWSQRDRVEFTWALATVLSRLLPDRATLGTLSTLPLGFSLRWDRARQKAALGHLVEMAERLRRLEDSTGRRIMVCLEMEPGCAVETTAGMAGLFSEGLPPVARDLRVPEEIIRRYLGVCFDVCHQAVMFEDVYESLSMLDRQGVPVGKIQLSSALVVRDPADEGLRQGMKAFAEDRYLHQVRTIAEDGTIRAKMDLGEALEDDVYPVGSQWRVHFHVPVMLGEVQGPGFATTQSAICRVLDFLAQHRNVRPHLEVETYTWNVLPGESHPRDRADLQDKLARELDWVDEELNVRQLILDGRPGGKIAGP